MSEALITLLNLVLLKRTFKMSSPGCVLMVNQTAGIGAISPVVTHCKSGRNSFLLCNGCKVEQKIEIGEAPKELSKLCDSGL